MTEFIGRINELEELRAVLDKRTASLVILKGRRRIGKSRLVEEFAKNKKFYAFSGLPPTPETTKQSQLNEFASQLSQMTGIPGIQAEDWNTLFLLLAKHIQKQRVIVLFDEISWMGSKDPDFLGKLKNAWDLHFKKNPKLMLILCGSVSSWIEENIIKSTGFLGCPSLYMSLEELKLDECNQFWKEAKERISPYEKFKVLSIIGGIPRYLELMNPRLSAEENIHKLCFSKHGLLVDEYDHIFADIFGKRSGVYRSIIEQLIGGVADTEKLSAAVGLARTGTFADYLNDLVLGGFISKDYTWHIKTGKISKLSYYRLKDNYLRFYLKYILPNKARITKGSFDGRTLTALPGWDSIVGLQFENLVINNHKAIIKLLGIRPEDVVFDNPYFQRKTSRQMGCQIDYMIQTRFNSVYVFEIKFSRYEIKSNVIKEMEEKLDRLKLPKQFSYRPVLIHVNGVREDVIDSRYFSDIINFSDLLHAVE